MSKKRTFIKEITAYFEQLSEEIDPRDSLVLDEFTRSLSDTYRIDEQTRSELLEGLWNIHKTLRKIK